VENIVAQYVEAGNFWDDPHTSTSDWWRGVAVAHFIWSTKLLYTAPG